MWAALETEINQPCLIRSRYKPFTVRNVILEPWLCETLIVITGTQGIHYTTIRERAPRGPTCHLLLPKRCDRVHGCLARETVQAMNAKANVGRLVFCIGSMDIARNTRLGAEKFYAVFLMVRSKDGRP